MQCWAQLSNKTAMDSLNSRICWPLHIDGAVRQSCAHRDTTLQGLTTQCGINVYMEPKPGFALQQLWAVSESAITQKTSPSYEVRDNDIRRAVMAITAMPAATLPDNAFILALGTPSLRTNRNSPTPNRITGVKSHRGVGTKPL